MLVAITIVCCGLLVWVWARALDRASEVLSERAGATYNKRRGHWNTAIMLSAFVGIAGILWLRDHPELLSSTNTPRTPPPPVAARYTADSLWYGPDTASIAGLEAALAERIRYGRALIANTAFYLGPNGSVGHLTNGMNCQNCHLDAGTKPWGNNYGAVWSQYPKFRERSGGMESVVKRVNDCIERSLNGRALDSTSKEMQSILAYMQWVGTGVEPGKKPKGSGIVELKFLDRPADPKHGEKIFVAKCMSCHEPDGSGRKNADGLTYLYPPLWGPNSYNIGAGLYRLSRFAGYVKNNMPQPVTYENPQLTDEDAWDVAAYVNSQQRPERDLSADWPRIGGKPVDHPFGPYTDQFTEEQHKFGPWGPIAEVKSASAAPSPKPAMAERDKTAADKPKKK